MSVRGVPEFLARTKAIRGTFKPYGKLWADTTASEARRRVPVRTGRLRESLRRKRATATKATVVGHYSANFVDAGSREHDIRAKRAPNLVFQVQGRTIFAKKVHKQRIAARRFKRPAALAALNKHPISQILVDLWNKAA